MPGGPGPLPSVSPFPLRFPFLSQAAARTALWARPPRHIMRTNATHSESGRFNAPDCFPYGRAGARSGRNRGLHLHARHWLRARPGHGAAVDSASPIDTFLIGSYQHHRRRRVDADLPISDVKAAINTGILPTIAPSICSGIRAVSLSCYPISGNLGGNVGGGLSRSPGRFRRLAFRFTENLIGSPALTPAEFARREPQLRSVWVSRS
jgi:hypothetical protein